LERTQVDVIMWGRIRVEHECDASKEILDKTGAYRVDDIHKYNWHTAVTRCNATTTSVPVARITSGVSATNSAAYARKRSASPAPTDTQSAGCDPRSNLIPVGSALTLSGAPFPLYRPR